ncbi:MAG: lipoate--protein ligase family protein [Gemmatimonadota bacterium]
MDRTEEGGAPAGVTPAEQTGERGFGTGATGETWLRAAGKGVPPETLRWRILRDPPADGGANMAMDVALARTVETGEAILRIYRWIRPTLSLGRNQPARGRFDPLAAQGLGAGVVRRPTGGREVLHDRELTYATVFPVGTFGGLRDSYRLVNAALVNALRSLGVNAALADPPGRTPAIGSGPCFERPAAGEVAVGGRKIAGSAQRRFGGILLQHGSLLLAPSTVTIAALRAPPSAEVGSGEGGPRSSRGEAGMDGHGPGGAGRDPTTLSELVAGPVAFPRVAAAVEAAMAGTLGGKWSRGETSPVARVVAEELLSQYESAGWTWRR